MYAAEPALPGSGGQGVDPAAEPPTVSAVVPTYNRRGLVDRAIESILSQTVRPDEIVVVDDGSTDGTADHLEQRFGAAIRVVRQSNAGVSAARRAGIEAATGTWIAFLDSDDEWLPGKIEAQRQVAAAVPADVLLVFGDLEIESGDDRSGLLFEAGGLACEAPFTVFDDAVPLTYPILYPLLQSSLIRRDALLAVDAFAPRLRSSEDLLVTVQLGLRGRFAAVPQPVTRLYRTPDLAESSLSRNASNDVDHCRARVLVFRLLGQARPADGWRRLHEEWVRGWAVALAESGTGGALRASLEQFRFGGSVKAVVFGGVALLGRGALLRWARARDARRPPADEDVAATLRLFG